MIKPALFLSVLIILLPAAFAETRIFSGTVITDTDKVLSEGTFRFTYEETSDKVFVQTPSGSMIVENGGCKPNSIFKVCINRANFSYRNITTYASYYELDTAIYKLTGSLSTSSKVTSTTLLPHESAEFTIVITNPTEFDITGIVYRQNLTPFSIQEVKGCSLDENQISWQGSLKSKYDNTCTAAVTAEKEGTFTLTGSLSYFNSYETEKKTTDPVAVTVLPKQLKITKLNDKNVEVRQPFYINTSLQNINKDERIEGHVTIELPSNIILLNKLPEFARESNTLRLDSILEPGSTSGYSLYLEANSESAAPVKEKFEYTIKNVRDVIENETFVNPAEPKLILNFSSEYAELTPGQEFIVIAKLRNPSRIHGLKDIKAKLTWGNEEIVQKLDRLMPNESSSIISNTLIAPKDEELEVNNKTIMLNLNVEYNFYESVRHLNRSLQLKIKPANATFASAAAKENVQSPLETKTKETPASQSQPINKTKETAAIEEKPKPKFASKGILNILLFVTLAFIAFLAVFFIVNRIRKRKKENNSEEKASSEAPEAATKK